MAISKKLIESNWFKCSCDNCGAEWYDDHNGISGYSSELIMRNVVGEDSRWESFDDQHYCPDCFDSYDDNDNIILAKNRNLTQLSY